VSELQRQRCKNLQRQRCKIYNATRSPELFENKNNLLFFEKTL
jgi:hypothetical protein